MKQFVSSASLSLDCNEQHESQCLLGFDTSGISVMNHTSDWTMWKCEEKLNAKFVLLAFMQDEPCWSILKISPLMNLKDLAFPSIIICARYSLLSQ